VCVLVKVLGVGFNDYLGYMVDLYAGWQVALGMWLIVYEDRRLITYRWCRGSMVTLLLSWLGVSERKRRVRQAGGDEASMCAGFLTARIAVKLNTAALWCSCFRSYISPHHGYFTTCPALFAAGFLCLLAVMFGGLC
jgi:hypothetical protein